MSNNTKCTGARIKELREAKGLSIKVLSDSSGISQAFLKRVEDGKRPNISATILNDVAKALDTELATFYYKDGESKGQVDIKSIISNPEIMVTYGEMPLSIATRETLARVIEEAIVK